MTECCESVFSGTVSNLHVAETNGSRPFVALDDVWIVGRGHYLIQASGYFFLLTFL